ncbi:MAG: AMP-binding protein [Verrucomicrobiota bacterium]
MANVLKKHGVKTGDRVMIYLPMIPEAVITMLACARIGAPHSVVFSGFQRRGAQGTRQRLRGQGHRHGRRRLPPRRPVADQEERGRGAARRAQGEGRPRRPAHQAGGRHDPWPRLLAP